jgi:transcriptional regulator with XRE-family HTH domain
MDEPKKRKRRTNPEQPKKRGRPAYTPEQKAEAEKRKAERKNDPDVIAAKEKRKQEYAENPDMYKKKEWSMEKPERLRGGAMQSLERYCTATDEEISQLMGNVVKFYELGKLAPIKNDDECEQRIDAYFQYIIRTGEKPSVEKLALSLGVTRRTLETWKNGERGSARRQALINYAYETLAAMDAELVNNNKIPQVTYIFRSKNFFGMKDQTEIYHHADSRKEIDEEELRKRIMENVIVDVDEDGNVI